MQNTFQIKLVNREQDDRQYSLEIINTGAVPREQVILDAGGQPWLTKPLELHTYPILVSVPKTAFTFGHFDLKLAVKEGNTVRKEITCRLLGP